MHNFHDCCAQHGVGTVFGRMAHRIEPSITCQNNLLQLLQFVYKLNSVRLQVMKYSGKDKLALMWEIGPCRIDRNTHVPKYKQNFAY